MPQTRDEAMRFPYSTNDKPLLDLILSLESRSLSAQALVDSGADVNVLPRSAGESLGAAWDARKTTLRMGGALAGVLAMPLLVMAEPRGLPAVRLAFAWCQTDDVPLVLGQTNFFMEFDVCFFRSRMEFSVVPKGQPHS